MSEPIYMKAKKTFYGTDGYIVAGQEFFTTSEALANQYYADGVAIFADGSEPEMSKEDLKVQARQAFESVGTEEGQTEFKTSDLERNVTSMANPVNLKIAVSGVNPEDLNIEVVRDEEVQAETKYVEDYQAQNQQPSQQQNQQASQNQAQAPQYQQQNQQPSQNQAQQRSAANQGEQQTSQSSEQTQSQSSDNQSSQNSYSDLERKEQELVNQLAEIRKQRESYSTQSNQTSGDESNSDQAFSIRHVGGGWYDLPNGERVQGKENAEARIREIESAYRHQQGEVEAAGQESENGFRPNSEYVQQANTGAVRPEDGQSLNQAQAQTYGALSGGQPQGGLSAQNEDRSMQGTGHDSGSTVNQSNQAQGMTSQASGAQGNTTGGTGQAGNTRGGATSSGGNNTGGAGQAGNTGGSTGGGNTGQ